MRSASLFYSRFWIGGTGRELVRRHSRDHVLVALYLITGPSAHMSGIYYLPFAAITEHTGIGAAKVKRILTDLERLGFCRYDPAASLIWVVTMGRWQMGAKWYGTGRDSRLKNVQLHLRGLPRSVLVAEFLDHYGISLDAPSEGASEGAADGGISLPLPTTPPSSAGRAGRPAKKSGGAR